MSILRKAIAARRAEIRLYDINIFNFEHVARQIGVDTDYREFRESLLDRVAAERHEKRKAEMVLAALEAQRQALPWWRRRFA